MKKTHFAGLFWCSLVILLATQTGVSQKRKTSTAKPKPIVFAVLNDGQTLEPIAQIDKGGLVETVNGGGEPKPLSDFAKSYYKPKSTYNLIFGGAANGTVTIKSADPKSECGKNLAQISAQSAKAKLKGFVMALATNAPSKKGASGVRRLPTAAERAEIEALVRAEFVKQGVSDSAIKKLNYYNLTAIDVDVDGQAEMVGTFWAENSAKERNLLFFIAEKDSKNKYNFGYSQYQKITPEDIMSGELKDLDELGGELLLDTLEFNGDNTAEIFTINKAFEGNNFHVYSRQDGKWKRIFEGYNYHCAY